MIDARDLRIGNWLMLIQDDAEIKEQEYQIDATDIGVAVDNPDRFSPIPLTPEVLENVIHGLDTNGFELVWTRTKRLEVHIQGSYLTTVDYLHQYQNLYHSLIGAELQFNNTPQSIT